MDNHITFIVESGVLNIIDFHQVECRGDNAIILLNRLIDRSPELFEGRKGAMFFADRPPPREAADEMDFAFCSSKYFGQEGDFLPMPCPYFIRWPHVGIQDGVELTQNLLENELEATSNKLFWIGADTHPARRALYNLSLQLPDLIDAEIMEWDRAGPVQCSRTRYVSLQDHQQFRYLIDCPGYGYSGRLRWLLATGRPVFIVDRDCVEHWHEDLVPWKHFVPVKADLSDLVVSMRKLSASPQLAEKIGSNAKWFVENRLTVEREIDAMVDGVRSHRKRKLPLPNGDVMGGTVDGGSIYRSFASRLRRIVSNSQIRGDIAELGCRTGEGTLVLAEIIREHSFRKRLWVSPWSDFDWGLHTDLHRTLEDFSNIHFFSDGEAISGQLPKLSAAVINVEEINRPLEGILDQIWKTISPNGVMVLVSNRPWSEDVALAADLFRSANELSFADAEVLSQGLIRWYVNTPVASPSPRAERYFQDLPGARLVVASYGENLDWTESFSMPKSIYDAAGNSPHLQVIRVENRAREAGQYLHHIVVNYPQFHEWEIFLQGNPSDHLSNSLQETIASSIGWDHFQPLGNTRSFGECYHAHDQWARKFANEWFGVVSPDIRWPLGAQFAVHRSRILQRSINFWMKLQQKVLEEESTSPWAMERLWPHVFGPLDSGNRVNP